MKEKRFFQFLAGPRKSEVLIFNKIEEEDDMVFISFMDKSRCNEDLILPINQKNPGNMLMAEVESPNNIWTFKEEWVGREEEKWEINEAGNKVCVQPFIQGRKNIIQTPPKISVAKFGNIQEPKKSEQITETNTHSNDPVWITLEKSKKVDTKINMDLVISLPSKSLFNVMKESFENGAEKTIDFIINNIDDKEIKTSLREALIIAYESNKDIVGGTELFEPEVIEEHIENLPQVQE